MPNYTRPRPGVSSVGQYQMSAAPYVARETVTEIVVTSVTFPQITKFVTVVNESSGSNVPLRIGFSENGVGAYGTNYFILDNGESYTGEWRLKSVYISNTSAVTASFCVIAGLTGIESELSGTEGPNYSGSQGVG